MTAFNSRCISAFITAKGRIQDGRDSERGDIVQTIIIIALILVIVIAVFNVLTPAIVGQGNNIADCIANAHKGTANCNF